MIKELTKHIEANTSFVTGTNLFAAFRPSNAPDICHAIYETFSPEDYNKVLIRQGIQILTRDTNWNSARDSALAIYDLLHGKAGITLPTVDSDVWFINSMVADSRPQPLPKDDKGRFEYSTHYTLYIQK